VNLPVIFHRAARAEFDEAHAWYEKQRPGLGEEFSERVHEVLNSIANLGGPSLAAAHLSS